MVSSAGIHRYTYRDYVVLEHDANVRHEFLDGDIYAMAGGTREHALICVNISGLLREQLRGQGCAAHSSDLRVRVLETGLATYPDVTVVCKPVERDPEDPHNVTNPTLVVEVTSPSTAAYDRGMKLAHYKRIPSLREILIVAHDERRIELWRRGDDGWSHREIHSGVVELTSVRAALPVDEIYRDELA